jgi:hypothetical protein
MSTRRIGVLACTAALAGCGLGSGSTSTFAPAAAAPAVFEGPVARANCGPGSRPEPDIQGRVPLSFKTAPEGEIPDSHKGYQCNLEQVAHEGDGALWQLAWYEDCAYYGLGVFFAQGNTAGFVDGAPNVPGGGTAVVKVTANEDGTVTADRTTTLLSPAMMDPWETLKANDRRGLLAGATVSIEGPAFDVYDIKRNLATDCATPVLASSTAMGRMGHEGEWAPDGLTYYSSGFIVPLTTAIDVSNPNAPVTIASINDGVHGLSLSEDGTRLYAAEFSRENTPEGESSNGFEIWDTTAIQLRSMTPTSNVIPTPLVGAVYWQDGGAAQMTIPVTIKGRPYVIFIDEGGRTPPGGDYQLPGMARIIDISDERNPVVVSKLKNEINMGDAVASQYRIEDGGESGFTYQGHYCGVPQREEPGIVACSYFWQGVRVFDIRDPYRPKEIAYFMPALDDDDDGNAHASSAIRLVPERGELWMTNQNTGLHILRFTNGVWPFQD